MAIRDTKGRREFGAWIDAHPDLSLASIGVKLGVSGQAVGGWRDGSSRPAAVYRAALHVLTGIEPSAWDTKRERAEAERVMRGAEELAIALSQTGS